MQPFSIKVIDFRNWVFRNTNILPNTQKVYLQTEAITLQSNLDIQFVTLEGQKPIDIANLFFKNTNTIAISPVPGIESHFKNIDTLLTNNNKEIIDYTEAAEEDVFFYGSNSLVANLEAELGICGINSFADESLFEEYCEDFELTPFSFDLPEKIHTSDIAFFIGNKLLICLDYIKDKKQKKLLTTLLKNSNIELITVTKQQVQESIFNAKIINNTLIITQKAYNLFTKEQQIAFEGFEVIKVNLPFLEGNNILLRSIII